MKTINVSLQESSYKIGKFQIINREMLKLIAILFMFFDHAYMTVVNVPGYQWMTQIGRLAFPIFAFQITEGYRHTSSRGRYLRTVFIFALISEIPYNLMMGGELLGPFHQNVMFTFVLALLGLMLIDVVLRKQNHVIIRGILILLICVAGVIVGTVTFVDYSGFGVLTVFIFYIASKMPNTILKVSVQIAGLWLINWIFLGGKVIILSNGWEVPEQGLAMLSLIFIWLYNGKKGFSGRWDQLFKYALYSFYPLHILILSIIALFFL